MNPEAPRRINFYFFFEEREGKRDRKKDKSSPVSASLSVFQCRSDLISKLSLVYFRCTSWISLLHSSELVSHLLPHASYLPPFLPSFLPPSLPR